MKPGSKVAYSQAWLRSVGAYTGDLPQMRGTIISVRSVGSKEIATVKWEDDGMMNVLVDNLALVGPNLRFCGD